MQLIGSDFVEYFQVVYTFQLSFVSSKFVNGFGLIKIEIGMRVKFFDRSSIYIYFLYQSNIYGTIRTDFLKFTSVMPYISRNCSTETNPPVCCLKRTIPLAYPRPMP